jgi:cytidylate kinase
MDIKSNSSKWDKLVNSRADLWDVQQKLEGKAKAIPISNPWDTANITISRTYGAQGYEIAKILGKTLNWDVYGRNLVEYISETAQARQRIVQSFDEKRKSEIQNWVHTLIDSKAMGSNQFIKHLASVLISIAEHGQAVIVGRGANFVLGHKVGFHVRIDAPIEWRAKQYAQRQKMSNYEARKIIIQHDSVREDFIRRFYQRDVYDATAYDMVLNMEKINVEKAADIILNAMELKFDKKRPEPDPEKEAVILEDDI